MLAGRPSSRPFQKKERGPTGKAAKLLIGATGQPMLQLALLHQWAHFQSYEPALPDGKGSHSSIRPPHWILSPELRTYITSPVLQSRELPCAPVISGSRLNSSLAAAAHLLSLLASHGTPGPLLAPPTTVGTRFPPAFILDGPSSARLPLPRGA